MQKSIIALVLGLRVRLGRVVVYRAFGVAVIAVYFLGGLRDRGASDAVWLGSLFLFLRYRR